MKPKTWIEETWPDGVGEIMMSKLETDFVVREVLSKFRDEVEKRGRTAIRKGIVEGVGDAEYLARNSIFREIGLP